MSDAQHGLSDLANSYQERLNSVSTKAVLLQLGVMGLSSMATLLVFSFLRPRHKVVFMPRYKYAADNKKPPKLDDSFFAWLPPLLSVRREELIEQIGLDAVIFLVFLRMCRWICGAIAVVACGMLIPINWLYNERHVQGEKTFFGQLSITNVRGNMLYVHVAASYLFCIIVYVLIYVTYKHVIYLRWQWFRSRDYQDALYARSIMLTHIAKRNRSDGALRAILSTIRVPYHITACHIGRGVGNLPELIERHDGAVKELEQVLTKHLRRGTVPEKRPTKKVAGMTPCGGRRVDSIDYLSDKIRLLETRIKTTRQATDYRKAQNYGFASFASPVAAHAVARTLRHKRIKGIKVELAPPPSDIVWGNLASPAHVIHRRQFISGILTAIVAAIYIIPLLAVSLLANLAALTQYVNFLDAWSRNYNVLFSATVGIAPPLLGTLLQLALPPIFRSLTRRGGAITEAKVDRAVLGRYFAFSFLTTFIIFTLIGVAFQTAAEVVLEIGRNRSFHDILLNLSKLPKQIQSTYISQSNFWLTWLSARAFSAVLDLVQLYSLVFGLRRKLWGKTPREIRETFKPSEFDYAAYITNMLLIFLVALVYAPLAPFVPLLASAVFFVCSWVYKYKLMYVCVTRRESGGRLWRLAVNRILFCVVVMNAFMCLTIYLQRGWKVAITTLPMIWMTLIFKLYLKGTFDRRFEWYIPGVDEAAAVYQHQADERKARLVKRFGHPSLHQPLFAPMLHSATAHLLPQVYSGSLKLDPAESASEARQRTALLGTSIASEGGLKFSAIQEQDLLYSTAQYLRQRDDDEVSIASTQMLQVRPRSSGLGPEAGAEIVASPPFSPFAMPHRGSSFSSDLDLAGGRYFERGPSFCDPDRSAYAPEATVGLMHGMPVTSGPGGTAHPEAAYPDAYPAYPTYRR